MKRKTHAIARSTYDNYVAWSNERNAHKMHAVTQRIDEAPVTVQFKQHNAHAVAHSEGAIVAEESNA